MDATRRITVTMTKEMHESESDAYALRVWAGGAMGTQLLSG